MDPDASRPAADRPELSPDEFSATVAAVTNAFGDPTRREIYLDARTRDGVTAAEVAERFDLHSNVARHHLEKLAGGGYLVVDLARAESAGRPSKRYRPSSEDAVLTMVPRRDDLLMGLLARALDRLGPEAAGKLADEVGFEHGQALAEAMGETDGHRSARAAIGAVADALTAHGFAAHVEDKGRRLAIISECCPFGEAAQLYPHVVCAVDRGLIRGMLAGLHGQTDPHIEASRLHGDDHCVARL
ncbi:MAG TPA: helix-turn-helix domain-containing protein [Acidimicrobiia bacterium]|nr:helix-turn-helix domain-containing protein [Acidimicrobiia bacterium]